MIYQNQVATLVPILFQGAARILCRGSFQTQFDISRAFTASLQTQFDISRAFTASLQTELSIVLPLTSGIQTQFDIWNTEYQIN